MRLKYILVMAIWVFSASGVTAYKRSPAYSGFGKISKVSRLPRTKIVSGHIKRTKRGIVFVNPNARSK